MNKIYRRLWSSARQCWVVTSELASPRGKPAATLRRSAAAVVVMLLALPAGAAELDEDEVRWWHLQTLTALGPQPVTNRAENAPLAVNRGDVYSNTSRANWSVVSGRESMALGSEAGANGEGSLAAGISSRAAGDRSTAVGNLAEAHETNSVAIGHYAVARNGGYGTALGTYSDANGKGATAVGQNAKARTTNSIAMGSGAQTDGGDGHSRIAIGADTYAGSAGWTGAIALGARARADYDSIVIGHSAVGAASRAVTVGRDARTTGEGAVALGHNTQALGKQSMALGQAARADGWSSLAMGASARSLAEGGLAFGYQAQVSDVNAKLSVALGERANASHANAVALGAGSVTTGTNQISVGSSASKRRIVNVDDGSVSASSTDAVTGRQLHAVRSELNATSRMVTQTSSSGGMRIGAYNSGNQIGIANSRGEARYLNGVRNGTLSSTSTDAVNGQQLNATNTEVATVRTVAATAQAAATAAKVAADDALSKANTLGGLVSQAAADGNVRLGERNAGTVLDVRNQSNANRTLSGLVDGAVNAGSSEAVTGKQLFATNEKVRANDGVLAGHTRDLAAQSGRIDDNRRELNALRSEFEDFDPDLGGVVKFAADGSVDMAGGTLRNVAAGDISSAASTDAVNGGQLFVTNQRIVSMERDARFVKIGTDEYSEDASAGKFAVAIGEQAVASSAGEGGTSIGSFSQAEGVNSVALGRAATVRPAATEGFALGTSSVVEAVGGIALGGRAQVRSSAINSVALGTGSYADESNVISVGGESLKRRIVNVSDGRSPSDVSSVGQLARGVAMLGGGAEVDGGGNIISPTYNVQGGTQNNVGEALTALDSAVVTAEGRVDSLEGKLRSAFKDGPSVRSDGLNQLTLAGANGSVLTNLADGRIAAGSRDAVTGSQLFEAKQEIARNRGDLDELRGERDGLLSRGLMAAEQGSVIDYGGARLTGVADGVISADSRDVVSGRQLFATESRLEKIDARVQYMAMGEVDETTTTRAGAYGLALGAGATASVDGEGGVAVGAYSHAGGVNSVALGRAAIVRDSVSNGFAVGTQSLVSANGGIAIGARSLVDAGGLNSVALGWSSVANEANTLSLGHANLQRRIVNVANGRNATDAATVGQLRGALSTLGGDIDANGNIINPTFNIQGGQQSSLNEALSTLDAAVVTNTNRTDRVESKLNAVFQDRPTVRNDGLNQLTFAGANGMVLSNVANGVVAAGSRDAVNGGQLHSMQQQLNGRMDGLERRIEDAPAPRALASSSVPTPQAEETPVVPEGKDSQQVASVGEGDKPTPQPKANKDDSPKPQVDTAELEKMLARANEYTDGAISNFERRLDKMDKRFNRMAAMSSAQTAMAMNTAGLATYNRLGAGVGYSEGESAMAVGYQRVLNEKGSATFSLNGAFTNSGERSMGVGVGIGW